jgi:hypothetical protein
MKHLILATLIATLVPLSVAAEDWKNVPLVDGNCLSKVKSDPDAHETSCLVACSKSGYGIITADGAYLKLDKEGNAQALSALKKTTKKDHIRVNVSGERKGNTISVKSLSLD